MPIILFILMLSLFINQLYGTVLNASNVHWELTFDDSVQIKSMGLENVDKTIQVHACLPFATLPAISLIMN